MDPTWIYDAIEDWHARIDELAGPEPEETAPDAMHGR